MSSANDNNLFKKRLKHVVKLQNNRIDGKEDQRLYIGLEHIESFSGQLIKQFKEDSSGEYPEKFENHTSSENGESLNSVFNVGDVLFGKLRPYLAKVWIATFSGRCTTELLVMRPIQIESRFLKFICLNRKFIDQVNGSTFGSKMPRADWDFIGNMQIYLPNLPHQRRIADYLDRETTRIDALVAAKQRALNLLAEKRKAVIAEAVTRGLDRSVPLRESGVAWLGKIPAHWLIIPIKYGFDLIGSGTTPPTNNAEYYDGNILWVTTSELRENLVKNTQQKITELALQKFSALKVYPSGSLLFAMYGATIGRVAILGCESAVNQAVCVISQEKLFTTQFVFFALQIFRDQLIAEASGGGQPNLNAEKLKSFLLGCPFLSEQHAIVKHITRETSKLDALVAATERSIALLNERRAALISAAVTGQIPLEAMS